jgi:beta-galactosidase
LWLEDRPILQLIPHWNWTGREGRQIRVMALTNVETVSLTLNGRSLGEKNVDKYDMAMWEVPYAAGRLEAVGKKDGQEVARCRIETTGNPVALRLTPDRVSVKGDGCDAVPVTVEAIDVRGRTVPEADFPVDFSLAGSGAIIGLGNGDPNSHELEKGNRRSLYHGLAQVILQTRSGGSGALVLNATAPRVRAATLTLEVLSVPHLPAQASTAPQLVLANWRVSPAWRERPDPNTKVFENDQNSWAHLTPGNLLTSPHQGWLICRTRFRPFASQAQQGGSLVFKAIAGPAEAWIDGRSVATKGDGATGSLRATFPPGQGERTLSLLLGLSPDRPAGLADAVYVEPLDA